MPSHARKFVIYAVVAALAVANGFAPRHAQAAHLHAVTSAAAGHHDHAGETADASHHHEQKAATCHGDAASNPLPGSPIHNCCVASCSAVAFIFASVSFDNPVPVTDYDLPAAAILTATAPTAADPPPR